MPEIEKNWVLDSTKRKYLSLLLFIVFALFQVNTIFYKHIHVVDGEVIVHAHPFSTSHSHTTAECSFYERVTSSSFLTATPYFELQAVFHFIKRITNSYFPHSTQGSVLRLQLLRAPPSL